MRLQRFILNLLCSVLLCFLMASCSSRRSRMRQQHRKEMRDRRNSNDDSYQLGNGKTSISGIVRGSNNGKALTPEEIYRRCNPAVFTVLTDEAQGSGFFINSSGVAVTNYHVLRGANSGRVELANNRAYQIVEVLKASEELDYAIFRVGISDKVPFLPISRKDVVIGEKAYAIGSPQGVNNTFSQGIVSQIRKHLIQISVPIDHGSSGGALLNEYGEVIGITAAGVEDSNADLNFAIDIHMLPL